MRDRLNLRFAITLLLGALLYGCSPYAVPHLPYLGSEVRYEVVRLSHDTIKQWGAPKPAASGSSRGDEYYDYVLGPGDTISLIIYTFDATGKQSAIRVYPEGLPIDGEDEFLVAADGSVTLPYVGTLLVEGRAFSEVKEDIAVGLSEYFIEPQFSVHIAEFAHGRVMVSGEVETPGEIFLSHVPLHASNAIAKAGGMLPTADLAQAEIKHASGQTEQIDLRALYYQGETSNNPVLRGGDTLIIPRGSGNQIFIAGEVHAPQTLTMHPMGYSLIEALQQTGGVSPVTGDPSQIYVIRGKLLESEDAGKVMIYHLDATNLAGMALADQFMLQPRDIVYVSMQPITQWNRIITQFLPGALSTVIGPQVEPRL